VSYEPWRPGFQGEGFLVREGTEDEFELALYRSDEIVNPILFILFVTQEHASGDPGRLFAAIGTDPLGRFMLRVKASEQVNQWRLARGVVEHDPRLTWAGPGELDPLDLGSAR
jgi:hypothetical protein